MKRLLLATITALGLSWVPVAVVLACSCAMPGTPAETAAGARLAFVGTVVDVAPAPKGPKMFGQMVRYAFQVERASQPLDAGIVELNALGGDGGASCGMQFSTGERWFIAAHDGAGGLETGLCSGNLPIEGIPEADVEAVMAVLPAVPPSDAAGTHDSAMSIPVAVWFGVAAVALVVVVAVAAFRRDDRRIA